MTDIWIVIYHDGNAITTARSSLTSWDEAPQSNVQFVMVKQVNGWKAYSSQDEYSFPAFGTQTKTGTQLSDEDFYSTRNYMVSEAWQDV